MRTDNNATCPFSSDGSLVDPVAGGVQGVTERAFDDVTPVTVHDGDGKLRRLPEAPPVIQGWHFLARLTQHNGRAEVAAVPGFDGVIDRARIRENWCDHCGLQRRRVESYILEQADTGKRIQVGSGCARDFLGRSFTPSHYDLDGTQLDRVVRHAAESTEPTWQPLAVIARAVAAVRVHGFVSNAQSERWHRPSTLDTVRAALAPLDAADDVIEAETRPNADDLAAAAKIFDWLAGAETDNDYLLRLKEAVAGGVVEWGSVGTVSGAPQAFQCPARRVRAHRASSKRARRRGRRVLTIEATVRTVRPLESAHDRTLHVLLGTDGNIYRWFAPEAPCWTEGDRVRLRGAVQEHDEYRATKSTVLTRCEVLDVLELQLRDHAKPKAPRA